MKAGLSRFVFRTSRFAPGSFCRLWLNGVKISQNCRKKASHTPRLRFAVPKWDRSELSHFYLLGVFVPS
jgi:hypothetical protein